MFLLRTVPLTNIPRPNPQEMSFFSSQKTKQGVLVEIKMRNKAYTAVVLECVNIKQAKSELRQANFTLKRIEFVLADEPVLLLYQIELAKWISEYYWVSLGLILKKFIPKYLIKYPEKTDIFTNNNSKKEQILHLYPTASQKNLDVTSRLSAKKEFEIFAQIKNNKLNEIHGTKRSLFAPYINLKKIVIYEELDQSHISWDQKPYYSAVHVAEKLAKLTNSSIERKGTLPSLCTYQQTISSKPYIIGPQNKLKAIKKGKNINLELIDLKNLPYGEIFTKEILNILHKSYKENKSVLMYVNRRGHSRLVVCRDCSFMPQCIKCSITLTYHKTSTVPFLLCHYCLYKQSVPKVCDSCSYHNLGLFGFGTQQVEQKLKKLFPDLSILRLDSDNFAIKNSELETKNCFIVSTSTVFNYNNLKFDNIIAVAPDLELNIPDHNALLYTLFNLWRLKNMALENFYLQTYIKENIVYESIIGQNYQKFYKNEIQERKNFNFPPFAQLIKLIYSHKNEQKARNEAKILDKKLHYVKEKQKINAMIFDFMPAMIYKIDNRYRYEIVIKVKNEEIKQQILEFVPSNWEIQVLET